jgi:uncharacterized protein (TIGR02444 family)
MEQPDDNPFWSYSLQVYARDGVAQACLALQDDAGIDVNFLLYGAWCAANNRVLTEAHLAVVDRAVAPWRESVLVPVRLARIQAADLKAPRPVYQQLLDTELALERCQQEIMLACYERENMARQSASTLEDNLVSVLRLFNVQEREHAACLARLCALLQPKT